MPKIVIAGQNISAAAKAKKNLSPTFNLRYICPTIAAARLVKPNNAAVKVSNSGIGSEIKRIGV